MHIMAGHVPRDGGATCLHARAGRAALAAARAPATKRRLNSVVTISTGVTMLTFARTHLACDLPDVRTRPLGGSAAPSPRRRA